MNYCRVVCSFCGPSLPLAESEVKISGRRNTPGAKKNTNFTKCTKCGRQAVVEPHATKQTTAAKQETIQQNKNDEEYSRIMERTRAELYRRMAIARQNEEQQAANPDARKDGAQ